MKNEQRKMRRAMRGTDSPLGPLIRFASRGFRACIEPKRCVRGSRDAVFQHSPSRRFPCDLILRFSFLVLHLSLRVPLSADEPISPQTEAAVDRGLKFIAERQTKEGTWHTNVGQSSAVTSLVTMAFLARGHVPGQGPYGEHLNRSIDFVLAHQQPNGVLSAGSGTMYDHGASTVMLCEAFGMVDDARKPKLEAAIARAAKVILDAQKIPRGPFEGGWRYQVNAADADISVTGWQLMALRGAANCGAAVPREALDKGVAYIRRLAVKGEGGF
jgi:hypothetical protein